jgi:hypothetical protein
LIIEYAKDLQASGKDLIEATLEAVHLRLRPILMTSFAFILGVMPLVVSTGAGSASRNAIGTGVAGGMFTATALGIFLIPVFYVVVRRIFKLKVKPAPTTEPARTLSVGARSKQYEDSAPKPQPKQPLLHQMEESCERRHADF